VSVTTRSYGRNYDGYLGELDQGKTGTCTGGCRRVYIKLWDWPADTEVTCRVNWGGTQTTATIRTDANGNANGSPRFSGMGYLVTASESDANEIACDGGTPRH